MARRFQSAMYRDATNVRCPSCGSPSNMLGAPGANRNRIFHHCQCSACLLTFDRIVATNGKGMTTLYAVPSSERSRRLVCVVPATREDAHAS